LAVASLALAPSASATQVYRCVLDGLVTYTDRECGDRPQPMAMDSAPAGVVIVRSEPGAQPAGPVAIGMSPREVRQRLGRPAGIGVRLEGAVLAEDWSYRRGEATLVVTFARGGVSRVTMH
jgi:hypothetical protein